MSGTMWRPRHRLPRGGDSCDFCGERGVYALYASKNFPWEGQPVFSRDTGRWAACGACAQRIDVQDWGQLNRRVIREVSKRHTVLELAALKQGLKDLHWLFALHVIEGEALKIHTHGGNDAR
jgi:hypothetical protein